jgi:hypothetical protein
VYKQESKPGAHAKSIQLTYILYGSFGSEARVILKEILPAAAALFVGADIPISEDCEGKNIGRVSETKGAALRLRTACVSPGRDVHFDLAVAIVRGGVTKRI